MRSSFIDLITGKSTKALISRSEYLQGIRTYLELLLNSHRDALPHTHSHGLHDLVDQYQTLPASAANFVTQLQTCINEFEPRITVYEIITKPFQPNQFHIDFILHGELSHDRSSMQMTVRLYSVGKIQVLLSL